ncbi:MAG: tRNA uridine-5-carboxymethylaminomethyl(34) synthesis GTPase MnmE [Candidatus Eisenbacteria bacterium]|uniref:tRNA modification GTPase MnmE n=1 Tax=Eiseniibacteriota bacterium TaxID=2212470 RepID=A0A7Y2E689_UNCEI|nr:tRNA uridine-5-carboxymethylaminomethyl(34) synthesis GTPase MnmE [Candidatus Eisenbacteria bacterium]
MIASSEDTIVALATPPGLGALAIVRLSGPASIEAADTIFRGRKKLKDLEGFEGAFGTCVKDDHLLDEMVAWVYRAPHSYTGENLVELSCHGGFVSAERILGALRSAGCRLAEPGEFTRRAFLNGRIDLAQAEAVAEVIGARGQRAQEQALVHLQGGLSDRIEAIASPLRDVLARLTVYLDFDEDVPEPPNLELLQERISESRASLSSLIQSRESHRAEQDGVVVALVGRPNVGKSSLMNALAGFDRAIVHDAPGTTRDVLELTLDWDGVPVTLIDTAGIRELEEGRGAEVEREGIERSYRAAKRADLIFWVADGSDSPKESDFDIGKRVPEDKPLLVILNKSDIGQAESKWVSSYSPHYIVNVSAKTGEGIPKIRDLARGMIVNLGGDFGDSESVWITSDRHVDLLKSADGSCARAIEILKSGQPSELAAADLTKALVELGQVSGHDAGSDLLDRIFSTFCIGK